MTDDVMRINVMMDHDSYEISVRSSDDIYEAIAIGLDATIGLVKYGDRLVQRGQEFRDVGAAEELARFDVTLAVTSFDQVVQDVVDLNLLLDAEGLAHGVGVDPNDETRISHIPWTHVPIEALPESLGNLTIVNDVFLNDNVFLTSLPQSFGDLKVGGSLWISDTRLTTLPESFGHLTVDGDLHLERNKLKTLPESFGSLRVGGNLHLYDNELTTLPESFGHLTLGGDLYLQDNKLTTLPESFGSLVFGVSGNLYLFENPLTVSIQRAMRQWFPDAEI